MLECSLVILFLVLEIKIGIIIINWKEWKVILE